MTFVAVKTALTEIPPLLLVGLRFALAAIASFAILAAVPAVRGRPGAREADFTSLRGSLIAGIPLGIILAGAYAAQTRGLTYTSPARSAFVTGLNVPLVPLCAWVSTRRRIGLYPLAGVCITLPGLWLLTTPQAGSWNRGDSWTVACAVLYALYIVLVTRSATIHRAAELLASQLATTAILALAASALLEHPHFNPSWKLGALIAFLALLATLFTTWLQIRLQPAVGPTRSAVIFATEPVFAAFFAWLLMGEKLPLAACAGGGLIVVGMVVSECGAA